MSAIQSPRPLATGIDTAMSAIRKAQQRFAGASAQIARSGTAAAREPVSVKASQGATAPAQPPPNPGPPGGAQPADLAQAFVEQNLAVSDLAANVKTVQAFSEMLEELTRLTRPG